MASTDWNISTDIYDIVNSVNNVKKRYLPDEDETTLALGVFGFLTDTESKKIQTSTIMTGELGNEMFPLRSKLTKNVLTHAIYNNIHDINAVPAHMTINMGIKIDDLNRYMEYDRFVIDHMCPIFVGKDYEFHFDYDIVIQRSYVGNEDTISQGYIYSAHYDMSEKNNISNITVAYLKQPFVMQLGNYNYLIFQALARQVTIEETIDKIIVDSIIANKTYTFTFENQIADFDVYVTDNGKETRLTPILYGSRTEGIENYCWYLFISDDTIRITFDSKSYIPGLNSDIYIKAKTTLGAGGNFRYKKVDETAQGFYVDISSDRYNYNKITCYMVAVTDSVDGTDRKTKAQLQKLIPKAALSRGSITTETDVENYFNLIDSDYNRLVMQKKVDNQLSRIWYGYFVLKDEEMNVIPSNTIKIQFNTEDERMYLCEDGRYVLPAGTMLLYDSETLTGTIIDESEIPELYTDEYFNERYYYYMTVYNLILNPDPLYAAFYLTITNIDQFFNFSWVNENSVMQFVANRCHFERNLLTDQNEYKFTFNIAQSIPQDYELYVEEEVQEKDPVTGDIIDKTIITNNMKTILVLYKNDGPYRWVEGKLTNFDFSNYISSWEFILETDNGLDNMNNIKILDLHPAGFDASNINYGYFDANTKAVVYILGKFKDGENGRYDLDEIAPGMEGYTVTNIYEVNSGLDFFENFTNVLDTKVLASEDDGYAYSVTGVPVVGLHYMDTEEHATYLIDAIKDKKAYIDYCLILLENSMNVDFKFFNTYGPSLTYSIGDKQETMINHVDLCMKFRVKLKNNSDIYTRDQIIMDIKAYVEDLYNTGDLDVPALITQLMNNYKEKIKYVEFMNYNNFWLGVQHIEKLDVDDPHIVPEFLNIRNRYNIEGDLEPCIDMEIVK